MSKVWMTSGVAIVALTAASAWAPRPAQAASDVLASQDLLAKAQSVFATKARDAVLQRRTAHGAPGSTDVTPPQTTPLSSDAGVPLDPAPSPAVVEAPVVVTPAAPVVAQEVVDPKPADVVASQPSPEVAVPLNPAPSPSPSPSAAVAEPDAVATTPAPVMTPSPVAAKDAVDTTPVDPAVPPKPTEATKTIAATEQPAIEPVAPSSVGTSRPKAAVTSNTRRASNQPATGPTIHRSEHRLSIHAMPHGLETLRSHAPAIADMIGRYMSHRQWRS